MKSEAWGCPTPWKRVAFIAWAHSHTFLCQEPGCPWRKAGWEVELTFRWGSWVGAAPNIHRQKVYEEAWKKSAIGCRLMRSPCSFSSCPSHCSVSQDGSLGRHPPQRFSFSWMVAHTQACKRITDWFIGFQGAEVGGLLDAPRRSHCEIIEWDQRAWSENNRRTILLPVDIK